MAVHPLMIPPSAWPYYQQLIDKRSSKDARIKAARALLELGVDGHKALLLASDDPTARPQAEAALARYHLPKQTIDDTRDDPTDPLLWGLVGELRHRRWKRRNNAMTRIRALGLAALPALCRARMHRSVEVQLRSGVLISEVFKQGSRDAGSAERLLSLLEYWLEAGDEDERTALMFQLRSSREGVQGELLRRMAMRALETWGEAGEASLGMSLLVIGRLDGLWDIDGPTAAECDQQLPQVVRMWVEVLTAEHPWEAVLVEAAGRLGRTEDLQHYRNVMLGDSPLAVRLRVLSVVVDMALCGTDKRRRHVQIVVRDLLARTRDPQLRERAREALEWMGD